MIVMNQNNTKKSVDESVVVLEVDNEVIDGVCTGEITHIVCEVHEDNQNMLLENIQGNLVLAVDEMPDTYHGCYFYNDGKFPYVIKEELEFILFNSKEGHCLTRIIGVQTEPATRFNCQGAGTPIVEDPNGDSCVWRVILELVPAPADARSYLMRWNPAISSFTDKNYRDCVEHVHNGMLRMDWSIYEWQEARRGDIFYMLRTGDDKAGIVFCGQFITDPYPGDDWAGTNRRRMYVDMVCTGFVNPEDMPRIPLERLQSAIPEVDWLKGHSGELLSEDVVRKLDKLFDENE